MNARRRRRLGFERAIDRWREGETRRRMTTTLCSMGSNQMNGILIEIDESHIFAAYERD